MGAGHVTSACMCAFTHYHYTRGQYLSIVQHTSSRASPMRQRKRSLPPHRRCPARGISDETEEEVLTSSSDGPGSILSLVDRCEVKQSNVWLLVMVELEQCVCDITVVKIVTITDHAINDGHSLT